MSKLEKINRFYEWLYNRVKSIHVVSDVEFENILEKL